MKTSSEIQQGVIVEPKLASNIIQKKERNQRILYIFLGVGIIFLVFGLISFLVN